MFNNLGREEKLIKRYLKNTMSVNTENLVKFLITGSVALTLTACGGGGGGGSSSSGGTNPTPPTNNQIQVSISGDKELNLTSGNNLVIGTFNSSDARKIAVKAISSSVESNANITVSGNNSIALLGTSYGKRSVHNITNKGNLSIAGDNSIGLAVENGVSGVNKGKISLNSKEFKKTVEKITYESEYSSGDHWSKYTTKYVTQEQWDYLIGMSAEKDSTVTNESEITLLGSGVGIYADSRSKGINKNKISVTSQKQLALRYDISESSSGHKDEYSTKEEIYSPVFGMYASNNSSVINEKFSSINIKGTGFGLFADKNSDATNDGEIYGEALKKEIISTQFNPGTNQEEEYSYLEWSYAVGMGGKDSEITNNGKINILNGGFGMEAWGDSFVTNNGTIQIVSSRGVDWERSAGISLNKGTTGINNGLISINGNFEDGNEKNFHGIYANEASSFINDEKGVIEIELNGKWAGDPMNRYYATGIDFYGDIEKPGTVDNKGSIKISSVGSAYGIYAGGVTSVNNSGDIFVESESTSDNYTSAIGIGLSNPSNIANKIENSGKITAIGNRATGIRAHSGRADILNTGTIIASGKNARGIDGSSGYNESTFLTTITNKGTISVDGEGAYGIYINGGRAINEKEGIINVGKDAAGGMFAFGANSEIINKGTINIDKENINLIDGKSELDVAMSSSNGGKITQSGTINSTGKVTINTSYQNQFIIGTSEDGTYGKLNAKEVELNGDIKVSADITKNGFKNDYTMQSIVAAEDIKYGEDFKFVSTSVLYDAKAVTDRWGNLDGKLIRNDKTISDFTTGYIQETADILGKYHNEEAFATLSSDAQTVIKSIDTESETSIAKSLDALTPTIYSNLGRQIFDMGRTFEKYTDSTISTLGEYSFNVSMIGDYLKTDSRNSIEGYKSKLGGFLGAGEIIPGVYGTLGYAYDKIDYDGSSSGKTQSIHLGMNKLGKLEEINYGLALSGEYNFNEGQRTISTLGRIAKSDFNSYRIGMNGNISKEFELGVNSYLKPFTSLELAYGSYDSFTETGAGAANTKVEKESYVSVLPKAGVMVGKNINGFGLYASADYSYQLGDLDKSQEFSFAEISNEKAHLSKDSLESGMATLKAGMNYNTNNINFSLNFGKEFGKRDNTFVGAGLGYKF